MVAFISHVTIDCRDAYAQAHWWKQVLGYVDDPDGPAQPGDDEAAIVDPDGDGQALLFQNVPEGKTAKNRIHLDLRPQQRRRDDELAWLLELGATEVADHRGISGPGTGWVVLADPEGNEFCILRSLEELEQG
jgi:catechol 2,3-dioxygenase-like lactoylglutathione lyase family enzyme